MKDEDIATIIAAQVDPDDFDIMLIAFGVAPSGNCASDFRSLADAMNLDPEDLLYALFLEGEDLFDHSTWTNLTEGDET